MCNGTLNMKISSYVSQFLIVTVALILYVSINSFFQRISGQYETRNVLLQVNDYNRLTQVVDNKVDSLNAFYTSLLNNVELYKLPFGYEVRRFYLVSNKGTFDLLAVPEGSTLDVDLTGEVKLVLVVYNSERQVYGESTCYVTLNASNVWEVKQEITTFIGFSGYDVAYICIICGLGALLLLLRRNRYTYALVAVKTVFLGIEAGKRCVVMVEYDGLPLMRYLNIASSTSIVAVFIMVYKVQADILSDHDIVHSVFCSVTEHGTVMSVSLLLIPFLHYLGVHILYCFVWAPILQCVVLSTLANLFRQAKDMNAKERPMKVESENRDINIMDDAILPSSDVDKQHAVGSEFKRYSSMLVALNFICIVLLVIFSFKGVRTVDAIKAVYNAINVPFKGTAVRHLFTELPNVERVVLTVQQQAKEVPMVIQNITSNELLKRWIKGVLPIPNVLNQLCLIRDRSGNTEYKLLDMNSVDTIMDTFSTIKLTMFLIFQTSDTYLVYTQVDFGQSDVGIGTFEDSKLSSMSTKPEYFSIWFGLVIMGILLTHSCLDMKGSGVVKSWENYWKLELRSQIRFFVIMVMLILQLMFIICRTLMSCIYIPELSKMMSQGGRDLDSIVSLLKTIPILRVTSEVAIFVNSVLTVLYVIMMLPRYYYSFTSKGEVIKRPIMAKLDMLTIMVYQYCILLTLWSLIGNHAFGSTDNHFRSFFTALRYNLILGFNKVLVTRSSMYIAIYNGITIMLFYNIGLTSLLGLFYYCSLVKEHKVACLETFDKYRDNFKVDIMANLDDIVCFKVFIKSLEAHKAYMEMNDTEVDHCKVFFERFPQEPPVGKTRLNPKARVCMYLERIKKYVLCIIFLRIKIRNLAMKIEDTESRYARRNPINESKRSYLLMLKQKLYLTVEEIKRFKRSTEILMTGNNNSNPNKLSEDCNASRYIDDDALSEPVVYDETDLERFILRPAELDTLSSHPDAQCYTSEEMLSCTGDVRQDIIDLGYHTNGDEEHQIDHNDDGDEVHNLGQESNRNVASKGNTKSHKVIEALQIGETLNILVSDRAAMVSSGVDDLKVRKGVSGCWGKGGRHDDMVTNASSCDKESLDLSKEGVEEAFEDDKNMRGENTCQGTYQDDKRTGLKQLKVTHDVVEGLAEMWHPDRIISDPKKTGNTRKRVPSTFPDTKIGSSNKLQKASIESNPVCHGEIINDDSSNLSMGCYDDTSHQGTLRVDAESRNIGETVALMKSMESTKCLKGDLAESGVNNSAKHSMSGPSKIGIFKASVLGNPK